VTNETKLAVILHADVVDSTQLVRQDERVAHERIHSAFVEASKVVSQYGGVTQELRGDALLADFGRASDAVAAALAIQANNWARNSAFDDSLLPVLRIGIALGEVVIADETVTGAGVVQAQRFEQLAQPGEVCISASVRDAIPDRFPFLYESLGEQSLKGFEEPMRAFKVSLRSSESSPVTNSALGGPAVRPTRRGAIALAIILLLVIFAVFGWLQPWQGGIQSIHDGIMPVPLADQPSIVVLPFDNLSSDPDQGYFADGLTEDLTTDLSKISGLFVISRNSAFSYKGTAVKPQQVASELGVRYLIEGSVRRAGNLLRINAQLIDSTTGGHLWAERYDGPLEDVFGFQDKVTDAIVKALAVNLTPEESRSLASGGTENVAAFDAFLRGKRFLNLRNEAAAYDKARTQFERAVSLDPNYANAIAGLGLAHWYRAVLGSPMASNRFTAFELAGQSLALADNALGHRLLARKHLNVEYGTGWRVSAENDYDGALSEMRAAVALEPNNADGLAELADILAFAGQPAESLKLGARARKLNPNFPEWYHRSAGIAHFLNGDYSQAIDEVNRWYESELIPIRSAIILASARALSGDVAAAEKVLEKLNTEYPSTKHYTLPSYSVPFRFRRQRDIELLERGLRKAGVPNIASQSEASILKRTRLAQPAGETVSASGLRM
jgi:TolB-like protein/class 3 adenylate cyclase